MAEPTFEDVETWLIKNADKEGTPDYVKMTSAYRALDPQKATPDAAPAADPNQHGWGERLTTALGGDPNAPTGLWDRTKRLFSADETPAPPPQPGMPNIDDIMAAKRLTTNPNSVENIADRGITGALGGGIDLARGVYNAGARLLGEEDSQVPYVTPQLQANAGAAAIPEDASIYQRLGEGALSAFLGGGAGAAGSAYNTARTAANVAGTATPVVSTALRMAAPTVVPTVTGAAGAAGGGALGEMVGDRETGELLGGMIGGVSPAVPGAARSIIHSRYSGMGRADAPEINAAALRQGVVPNAAMLGNDAIGRRERTLVGQAGSAPIINAAQQSAREGIGNAYDRAAEARGSTDTMPAPGTIGYDVADVARQGVDEANALSSAGQQELMERIGPRAAINAASTLETGREIRRGTDPITAVPSETRLTAIRRMIEENPANYDADGNIVAHEIPYERWKDLRTNLREKGEGYDPVPGRHADTLYDAMTEAMRETGEASGVPREVFDATQQRTARLTGEGGPVQTLRPVAEGGETAAYNYLRRGEQQPGNIRRLINTGIEDVDRVLGDYMRMIGNYTINRPGARGPANLVNRYDRMTDPARQAILGPQYENVSDVVGLARAFDVPTNQNGLTRAVGGQAEGVANKVIGSEALGHVGAALGGPAGGFAGRILGVMGMPALRAQLAGILQGPTARNALAGGQGPGGINALAAAMTAAQQAQQPHQLPPITVEP